MRYIFIGVKANRLMARTWAGLSIVEIFWIAFSEICCLWGVKANRLMDKDLGRAFNFRDFFGLPSMRYILSLGDEG